MSEEIKTLGEAIDRIAEVMLATGWGDFEMRVLHRRGEGSIVVEVRRDVVVRRPNREDVKVGAFHRWDLLSLRQTNFARSAVYHDIRNLNAVIEQRVKEAEATE